jgi:1,4-dihydroxy-2-naphthoate polyprenyltransferase
MRDIHTDKASGKNTTVVRMGLVKAKTYHLLLIGCAFICLIVFNLLYSTSIWQWSFLLTLPLFIKHLSGIIKSDSAGMDKYLKQLAISALLLVLCFGISISLKPYV